MVRADFSSAFKKKFSKIKDEALRVRVRKQIKKLKARPKAGKPMKNLRRGTRELYVSPFRLSYLHIETEDRIVFLDLYHKDEQ